MEQSQLLEALQELVAIGAPAGLKLLAKNGHDVKRAANAFKSAQRDRLCSKTGITASEAGRFLESSRYDLLLALQNWEAATFTKTELIFRHNKKADNALFALSQRLQEIYEVKSEGFYIPFNAIKHLEGPIRDFLIVNSWMVYAGWENFESALYLSTTEGLIEVLGTKLGMEELATVIERSRELALMEKTTVKAPKGAISYGGEERVVEMLHPEVDKAWDLYYEQEDALDARLVAFVKANLEHFP